MLPFESKDGQVPSLPLFKNTIVDVRCQDRRGRQLEKNDEYELLKPVYGLSLLNDKFPGGSGDYYHHFRLVRAGAQEQVIRDLQLV
ncbi:MAG: hypothetical protein KGS60_11915, partial [Verrucomicrobia bacterium]|nr:hypothetical protein [Verrucomicrobiota bacterium]